MAEVRLDSVKYSDAKSLWSSQSRTLTGDLPHIFHVGDRINMNRTQAKDILDTGFFVMYFGYYMTAITSTNPATKDTLTDEGKTWVGDISHPQYAQLHPELPLVIYSGSNKVIQYIAGAVPSYYEWIQTAYGLTNIDFVQGGHLGRDYLGIHDWTSDTEYVFHKADGNPIDLPLIINTVAEIFKMPALLELSDFYTTADTLYWNWTWTIANPTPYKHGGLSLLDIMNNNGYTTYTRANFNSTSTINAGFYANWEDWAFYGGSAESTALYETDDRFYNDSYGAMATSKNELAKLIEHRTTNFESLVKCTNPLYNIIADMYGSNVVGYTHSSFTTIYNRPKITLTMYPGYSYTGDPDDEISTIMKRGAAQISESYSYNVHLFAAFITSRLGTSIQGTDDSGVPIVGDDPLFYKNQNPTSMDVPNIWEASHAVLTDEVFSPTIANGCYYIVTNAGTTGLAEPVWNTTPTSVTNDNGVQWTCYQSKHLTTVGEVIMMTKFAMTMGAVQVDSYVERFSPSQSFWSVAIAYEEMQKYHEYIKYGINYQPNLCKMYFETPTSKNNIPTVFYAKDSEGNDLNANYLICARTYNGKVIYFGADLGAVDNTAISTVQVTSPFNTVNTVNMSRYGTITEI